MPSVLTPSRLHILSLSSSSRRQEGARGPERGLRRSQLRAPPGLGDVPAASSHHDLGPRQALRPGQEAQARSSRRSESAELRFKPPLTTSGPGSAATLPPSGPTPALIRACSQRQTWANPALPPQKLPRGSGTPLALSQPDLSVLPGACGSGGRGGGAGAQDPLSPPIYPPAWHPACRPAPLSSIYLSIHLSVCLVISHLFLCASELLTALAFSPPSSRNPNISGPPKPPPFPPEAGEALPLPWSLPLAGRVETLGSRELYSP